MVAPDVCILVGSQRTLGILLDPVLFMDNQMASVVQSAYFHLGQIAHLGPCLDAVVTPQIGPGTDSLKERLK